MLFAKILLIVSAIILISYLFIKYEPKFDLVKSKNNYILFLWYNKYDWNGNGSRKYIKLFTI